MIFKNAKCQRTDQRIASSLVKTVDSLRYLKITRTRPSGCGILQKIQKFKKIKEPELEVL
jgi:hypothetical protein